MIFVASRAQILAGDFVVSARSGPGHMCSYDNFFFVCACVFLSNLIDQRCFRCACSHSFPRRMHHMVHANGVIEWWMEQACGRVFFKKYFFVPNEANQIWVTYCIQDPVRSCVGMLFPECISPLSGSGSASGSAASSLGLQMSGKFEIAILQYMTL